MLSPEQRNELDSLVDYSGGFFNKEIKGFLAPSELVTSEDKIAQCIDRIGDQGLLLNDASLELAIWRSDTLGEWEKNTFVFNDSAYFSCSILQALAQVNAGLAFEIHQRAMDGYVAAILSKINPEFSFSLESTSLSLFGHYGLARYSLALYLTGSSKGEDNDVLRSYFLDSRNSLNLFSGKTWSNLLHPYVDEEGVVQLRLYSRDALSVAELPSQHGLNELKHFYVSFNRPSSQSFKASQLEKENSRQLFANLIQVYWLGSISIALGALSRSYEDAREYASQRKQGGDFIANHPAVRLLLSEVKQTVDQAQLSLENVTCQKIDHSSLLRIASLRSHLLPLICNASNKAMQVYGGMGYMRDVGAEKIVRDCMQLSTLGGSAIDLGLFISVLEDVQ